MSFLSLFYGLIVRTRNFGYTLGFLKSRWVNIPVISIGNITAGGTGKTPLVIWLCNYLQSKDIQNCILTRGYKTQPGQITDEPALLAKACPDSAVVVNRNRLSGAKKAIRTYQPAALVLDDGFQHRRLRCNLDILTVDATCPFGYGRILPAGLLREPLKGLSRASAVIITRADQVSPQSIYGLKSELRRHAPNIPIATTTHTLSHAVSHPNRHISLDQIKQSKVYAFCGIGNPDAFFGSMTKNGFDLCGTKIFDDHHIYTIEDIESIYTEAQACSANLILCTQKDWVKSALLVPEREEATLAYLAMKLDFLEGLDKITPLIDALFEPH